MDTTWTALVFSDPAEQIPPFIVWKAVRGEAVAAGASPEQARNRLEAL